VVDNSDQVIVNVKDSGQGIDPEIIPKLFSKFVAKSEKGTGLGLFISKSIVEAHGGKIWGQNNNSEVNTRGATFTFSLPLVRLTVRSCVPMVALHNASLSVDRYIMRRTHLTEIAAANI
jgi:signal transduction histidine kinase